MSAPVGPGTQELVPRTTEGEQADPMDVNGVRPRVEEPEETQTAVAQSQQ